ncbi:hypothetical protein F5146DRAFT_501235 [Armillaria mellea]|nr:hypothetical protein F5146DRAFT_501235 [Armillaria mellea]
MSTGTVSSERASHPNLYEPDDQWKAELKEKLSVAFQDMLLQAKQKLEADLTRLGGDNIDPVERKKLIDEYQVNERQIKSFAAQSFRVEVEKEREQRRWAAGLEIRTEWRADLENEQMAIMSGIRRQRTGSAGAESNANPKGLDKGSTEPDHLPGSRQQTTTTMPASVAPRPSPIPIPTAQRRSSTSGTPGNSANKNPEVWIPPKSAAEDKPTILGRHTSQASIRTSSSQIFRPSAPIPETQKPPSNTESRPSSSYASKANAPLPEIPKHATTEHNHSESRTSSLQTSRPPGYTLENQKHPDRDSRSSPSHTFRPSGSIPENNRRSIPEHDDAEGQSSATRPSPPIHDRANAELERARMDQAEQPWASHSRVKGKEVEVERDWPPSPSPRSVSVNQDLGPPPAPPMATKPAYNLSSSSLLTMSRPNNTPDTLRPVSSSSDGHSPYRQPTLDSSSPSSYRQPSLHTSSSSLSRQSSLTFSHNNPNHHTHPSILPVFPPSPIPADATGAYHPRYASLQSPSQSAHAYGVPQTLSHPQRQPTTRAQGSNLHSPGSDQPAWKQYAEHSDGSSESFSEDDETTSSSSDRDSFTREGAPQDDVHLQEPAHTTEPLVRRERLREDVARREDMSRQEEERWKELERKRKEEENRRNELDAARKAEEEAQRKAEEIKKIEEEAERRAEEARRIQAEAEMKAAILKEREEALRQREQELEKREREAREAELKRREEELKRREEEVAKKEAEDQKRRQEESERREAEAKQKAEQERLEARHKAEQERLEEETAKAREKQQIQEDKELAERLHREQTESSWKEKDRANKIKADEERKRAEERRKGEERRKVEERRKLEEFQATQARARRKEEEAKQQQADFQRREEEIRRKRQDSWTSEDSKARSASGWGPNPSASASSSTRSSSSTGPNPASGWKQTTPNSSRTPTSPSTPGYKPRTGSSSYSQQQFPSSPSGTPHTPVSDTEWRRRQEEQARAQQEKFRAEQQRLERERQAKEAGRIMSKEEVVRLFQSHETQWQKLTKGEIENVIWDAFPWPMVKKPKDVADINAGAIQAYVLNPHFPNNNGKGDKDKIKEQIRRWHPDRFERLMPRVAEGDRDRVREGAGEVVRGLNDLLTKFNGPAGMFG